MRWPTIDETRAAIQLIGAVTFALVVLYLVVTGKITDDIITALISVFLAVDRGVNGLALYKRNSTGKKWADPHGEKQDRLP